MGRTANKTHFMSVVKTNPVIRVREIMAVCSEIHTKDINVLCGEEVEFLNLAMHITTTRLRMINDLSLTHLKSDSYYTYHL